MRFIHTADWHLGKYFCQKRLTEDQRYLLEKEFLPLVRDEKAEAVVLAGDIYDRGVPEQEAVALFDEVLAKLAEQKVKVFAIAGNHDSGQRIDYGRRLFQEQGVFIRGLYEAADQPLLLEDAYGSVAVALLPFVTPNDVRSFFLEEKEELKSYDQATGRALAQLAAKLPAKTRSIAVAHAFVAGKGMSLEESSSERELSVGGAPNVSPEHFRPFHYTALGHIHRAQTAGGENIRYSGSLLKYSFDEAMGKDGKPARKSVLCVELDGKGQVSVKEIPLTPRHDMRRVRGTLAELLAMPESEDYIEAVLTDKEQHLGTHAALKEHWPNLSSMRWEIEEQERLGDLAGDARQVMQKSILTQFEDFVKAVDGPERTLTEAEQQVFAETVAEVDRKRREAAS